jgi:hypothetical protein
MKSNEGRSFDSEYILGDRALGHIPRVRIPTAPFRRNRG